LLVFRVYDKRSLSNKLRLYSPFAAATGIENAQKLKVLIKTRIFGGPRITNCGHFCAGQTLFYHMLVVADFNHKAAKADNLSVNRQCAVAPANTFFNDGGYQ
jgi:hypothetical protein